MLRFAVRHPGIASLLVALAAAGSVARSPAPRPGRGRIVGIDGCGSGRRAT
jgi:hypothetical protein